MNTPQVYVIVINWNGLEHLAVCLDSVLAQTYANIRVLLVDNASEDESVAFARERYAHDPRFEVLCLPRNLGWSGGNNAGMYRALNAGADYLFLLNNDTWTAPDAVEKMVTMAESLPDTGAIAPKMLLFDYPAVINSIGLESSLAGAAWDRGVGRLDAPAWNRPTQVIGVCGGACFLRAAALRKTGLLPEDFEIYLDDLDLCLRIWNAGYSIWTCPEAVVRHKFSATLGQGARARRKYYLNTRNRFRIILRNYPARHALSIALAVVVAESRAIGRALLDGEAWRAFCHVRAWLAGVLCFPRAVAERVRRWRAGFAGCRFWHLVRREPLFCRGFCLPEAGWYPTRMVQGKPFRPISARADLDFPGGRLRVRHANCYPRLGATEVRVQVAGSPVATLSTSDMEETILDLPAGLLTFESNHIYFAEDTGEIMDIGGWISLETLGAQLDATRENDK